MQFPDISSLPPWAQMTLILAFGASSAIIVFVTRFGWQQGLKTKPDTPTSNVTLATVVVDATALNRASAAIEAHTEALEENNALRRRANEIETDGIEYIRRMFIELDRIREELRIQRELAKYSDKVAK